MADIAFTILPEHMNRRFAFPPYVKELHCYVYPCGLFGGVRYGGLFDQDRKREKRTGALYIVRVRPRGS